MFSLLFAAGEVFGVGVIMKALAIIFAFTFQSFNDALLFESSFDCEDIQQEVEVQISFCKIFFIVESFIEILFSFEIGGDGKQKVELEIEINFFKRNNFSQQLRKNFHPNN